MAKDSFQKTQSVVIDEINTPEIHKCPKCECLEVEEVSDGVVERHFWGWNEELKKFCWESEDSENYGEYFLRCPECGYRYTDTEQDKITDLFDFGSQRQ